MTAQNIKHKTSVILMPKQNPIWSGMLYCLVVDWLTLDCLAQVVSLPLLVDNRLVDLPSCEVVFSG